LKTRIWLLLLIALGLLLTSRCSNLSSDPVRSIDELSQAGFYAYILPSSYENELGWTRIIKLSSFDKQCSNFFSEDTWNPIYISYTANNQRILEIRISPQDAIWDLSKPTHPIDINATWIPIRQGEFYFTDQGQTFIKVKDNFGLDVIFSSTLSPQATVEIINWLEYAGPEENEVTNPWQTACGNK
jgi:hypothetical protein